MRSTASENRCGGGSKATMTWLPRRAILDMEVCMALGMVVGTTRYMEVCKVVGGGIAVNMVAGTTH